MELRLYLPKTAQKLSKLEERTAKIHAEAAVRYLSGLDCSDAEKAEILDMMIGALNQNSAHRDD